MDQRSRIDTLVATRPRGPGAAPAPQDEPRERSLSRMAGALRQISRHPALWTLVSFVVFWRVYVGVAPQIDRVSIDSSGRLEVIGRRFGPAKGQSRLDFGGKGNQVPLDIVEWKDQRITANLGTPTNGSVTLTRDLWSVELPQTALVRVPSPDLPSQPYGYTVPVQPAAPWPLFRRDQRNTGRSDFPANYDGSLPWAFQTGNTVASTPVIDENGVAYFGSGDGSFYAVDREGQQLWSYPTGGRIGGAGALIRASADGAPATVVFPAANGRIVRVGIENDVPCTQATFETPISPQIANDSIFESNIGIGDDGTIYAGNNGHAYYAVTAAATPKWVFTTSGSARSTAAVGTDGTIFWGGVDGSVYAVNTDGSTKWTRATHGAINASAALGSDGTVYVGSFDGYLYALNSEGGRRWSFKTNDHITATVALGEDARGNTTAIYVPSTDGRLYALNPRGMPLWQYDSGEAIRSSPAVGLGPKSRTPGIVYFGSANGKVYAINAADGRRRWSFDTTPADPRLADYNNVSSSVALGSNGIYAGTESGALWFIPYDYCLHADDPRCNTAPDDDLPSDVFGLFYVSPGGTTYLSAAPRISPATVISLRLLIREYRKAIGASLCNAPSACPTDKIRVETQPAFPFRSQVSPDGHYLHLVPLEPLQPDTDYKLRIEADYYTGGPQMSSLILGSTAAGTVIQELTLRTEPSAESFSFKVGADVVSALELTWINAPMPTTLTSLHQAGLNASNWILSAIYDRPPSGTSPGRAVLWGIGARRDESGRLVPDPDQAVTMALNGRYDASGFIFEGGGFVWTAGSASFPVDRFELRGQLDADMNLRPGASFFAETSAASTLGIASPMILGGLVNSAHDNVFLGGTFRMQPYDPAGTANRRPSGVRVSVVERARPFAGMAGKVVADLVQLSGKRYKTHEHRVGVVLVDHVTDRVVPIDYANDLYIVANSEDEILQVILSVPPGTVLSHDVEIVVLVDAFPVHRSDLGWTLAGAK